MLIPHFYSVKEFNFTDNQLKSIIELNPEHDVFKGHFPNNPVTPGVCMLQILKELTEQATNTNLFIKECSNVKFMALINPEVNPILEITIDINPLEENFKIKASASFNETVALKVNALLTQQL
ncbi:3-hydroxyacyl-[acyl-carrier-protein] dehydratase [Paenimyroides ummariense]|uniref:3-hydroxyacyl-[acyl-carrier-protein] dehydratase n=1 Tax=Paenimyroides ummariense TaxID=913024 RepID=A0A1I4X1D8_9FLAO|nr:3-hydroxyacyl-ACP dehydratase [Paenimyroides ummariense]SFN19190.1 3-hydroxyacyl-[acyl-carrier-protein] dehydratase [Paenimyroides ummariense]